LRSWVFVVGLAAVVVSPAAAQTGGGTACYKVRDRARPGTSNVTVSAGGAVVTCRVSLPARLACTDAETGAGAVLCYPLHCPRPFPPTATMTDELGGQRVVKFKGAQLLCEPATRDTSTTSTTVASVTTTTDDNTGPCDWDGDSGTCKGTCGGSGHCSAVLSGGACECRSTPCGDADSPECEGYCDRDEACVYDLDGCRCVSIP
jgi:hypothetical protein